MAKPQADSLPKVYDKIVACRACLDTRLELVLSLGEQYLVGFLKEKDLMYPRAPLDLVRCIGCGLLQLGHSMRPDLLWREYWYRSGINETMRNALRDVVRHALKYQTEGSWLDIGANDGTLLSMVPPEFAKTACEPALNMAPLVEEHADVVVSDYFSAARCPGPYSVVTSCACFYDVDNPGQWVEDIRSILTDDGIWVNQFTDAATMIEKNDFPNICHEHATFWDVFSLKKLYDQHGLHICSISHNDVNGGSLRVIATKIKTIPDLAGMRRVTTASAAHFARRVMQWKHLMRDMIFDLPGLKDEPIWGYAASTKGSVMLQYLDASDRFIAIADRNPAKVGLRMAGTWIPITTEATMRATRPRFVMPLAWAFRKEFLERELTMRDQGTTMLFPLPNPELVL